MACRSFLPRHQAEQTQQVWAMDFQFDASAYGRRVKFLSLINENRFQCLVIRVERRCRPGT